MRGSKQVTKLERSIAETEAKIDADGLEIGRSTSLVEAAHRERDELARAEADGTIDAKRAGARLEEIEAKADRHRREIERLGRVVGKREGDLLELRRQLEHARYEAALAELEAGCAEQIEIAARLAKELKAAAASAELVRSARGRVDELVAAARELMPEDVDAWPEHRIDEPDWDVDGEMLVEILQAGPRQPNAEDAASWAAIERRRQAEDEARIHAVRRRSDIERLPDHLRPEAERRWAAAVKRERKRRDAERELAGLPPIPG